MSESDEKSTMLYVLAGVGVGALIGVAAGMLFAPKAGTETREDLSEKFKELKAKTEEWVTEQKAKRNSAKADETPAV